MADILLPLTTKFTPPPDCLASITYSDYYLLLGADETCRPSGAGTIGNAQYFSPGLYCPNGWTSAAATTITVGTVTETRATCCPSLGEISFTGESLMYADTDLYYGCTAWISGLITASVVTSGTVYPTTFTAFANTTEGDYGTLQAQIVQLAWQASDLHPSSSSSASQTATPTPASPTPSPAPSSGGLSKTAKIAIGVVIPVVVLAALALGVYLILRRRKTKARTPTREIQQEIAQAGHVNLMESTTGDNKYGYMDRTPDLPGYASPASRASRDTWNTSQR